MQTDSSSGLLLMEDNVKVPTTLQLVRLGDQIIKTLPGVHAGVDRLVVFQLITEHPHLFHHHRHVDEPRVRLLQQQQQPTITHSPHSLHSVAYIYSIPTRPTNVSALKHVLQMYWWGGVGDRQTDTLITIVCFRAEYICTTCLRAETFVGRVGCISYVSLSI